MHVGFSIIQQNSLIKELTFGSFSGISRKEIIISRDNFLEIFILEKVNGKITSIWTISFFSQIIFHTSFHFKNEKKDYLFICDLKGKLSILEVSLCGNLFEKDYIDLNNFFKKKIFAPLNFALDNQRLIFMVCTIQQTKFISYIKKNQNSWPFFSKKTIDIRHRGIICYYIIHIENETESKFACIETSYNRPYDKFLVFYYVNMSFKNVKRKIISRINSTSYLLIHIPKIFNQNETVVVFSEIFYTIVNPSNLKNIIKNLPYRKKKNQNKSLIITSTSLYKDQNRMFFLLISQDSDLLQMSVSYKFIKKNTYVDIRVEYLDSIKGDIKCGCILPNGFLFLAMESGNHLYLQLLNIYQTKYAHSCIYFFPRSKFKNIILVEEFLQNSPIISADINDFITSIQPQILLLCGTKSKSSLRLLSHSYIMNNICLKKFKKKPIGINIIEINKNLNFILISFVKTTKSFFLDRKLEETNCNYFIADSQSIIAQYINSRKGMLQTTTETLRFIKLDNQKTKICEWKPAKMNLIVDSIIFDKKIVHVFLILSSSKGILIEIIKDGLLLELDNISLEKSSFMSLFGVYMKMKKWSCLIILGKTEKSIRSYTVGKTGFIKISGIQVLPWSPESAKIFYTNGEMLLLISLNNGILIEATVDSYSGQFRKKKVIKISKYPLYISRGNFSSGILIFGIKVWMLHNSNSKNISIELIHHGSFDLVECANNIILTAKKNIIRVWKHKKSFMPFSKFLTVDIPSTPKDLISFRNDNKSSFISFICSDIGFKFLTHQMTLSINSSNFMNSIFLSNEKENKLSTILFLSPFLKLLNQKMFYDFISFRGAEINKYWNSLFFKKMKNSIDIIIVSSVCLNNVSKLYSPMIRFIEKHGRTSSLIAFYVKKKTEYNNTIGGRKKSNYKLNYIFETVLFPQTTRILNGSLCKKLLANRFVICSENIIVLVEVNTKYFQKIFQFNGSSVSIKRIDVIQNKILIIDEVEGFKFFSLKYQIKSYQLHGEKMDLNHLLCGKILDPITVVVSSKNGGIYFYRLTDRYLCDNNIHFLNNQTHAFDLVSYIHSASPVKEILFLTKNAQIKHFDLYLICQNGTLIYLKPILKQKNILFLEKTYNEIHQFLNINKINSMKKINFEIELNSFNLDKVRFLVK